ncbi:DUF6192 family protein [Streptomyces sp. OE57]
MPGRAPPPFNQRTSQRRWTHDSAKRLVGQRVDRPVAGKGAGRHRSAPG